MDLIISMVILAVISTYKMTRKSTSVVQASATDEHGFVTDTVVDEVNLIVGKNLMLRREPRAYHKILDEMGLS
jgi:hypothetical protein